MSEHEGRLVKIFIDQASHHSPTPTTGAALYELCGMEPGLVLFRELTGDRDDPEVPSGAGIIDLREDEHFHRGKPRLYHLIVNAQAKTVATRTVTYGEVVALAFPEPITGPNIIYTVGFEDGPRQNPSGSLVPRGTVRVKDGMIFDVTPTDRS